jgi:hypothetical protein
MASPQYQMQPETAPRPERQRPLRQSAVASPEAVASILVGVLVAVLVSSQVIGGLPAAVPATSSQPLAPSGSPTTSPSSSSPFGLSPLIRSSLDTVLIVDERLTTHTDALRKAIALKKPAAEDIASILRSMNTELAIGSQAASQLQVVLDTAKVGDELVAFYDAVTARNSDTLGNSIRSVKGYIDGGAESIKLLAGLRKLDDRVRAVMLRAGIDISPSAGRGSPAPSSGASP